MNIVFTDLETLHRPIEKEISQAMNKVVKNNDFIQGTVVKEFEQNLAHYMGGGFVQSCGNGTDAITIAVKALGLKAGDSVLVPSFSYFASAEAISILGIEVVFYDINPQYFTADLNSIKKCTQKNTKAVLVTNLYGQAADLIAIKKYCTKHELFLIEDNAQAMGAKVLINGEYKMAGTIGDISTTSFFPTKSLGGFGDGGAIFSKNKTLIEQCKILSQHGQTQKYQHDIIGFNSRLDSLQAAVLNVKLNFLDSWNAKRNSVAKIYQQYLPSHVAAPAVQGGNHHIYHLYTVLFSDNESREKAKQNLSEKNIPAFLYYPKLIHQQKAYSDNSISLPQSEDVHSRMLTLPMHPYLTEKEIAYITAVLCQ